MARVPPNLGETKNTMKSALKFSCLAIALAGVLTISVRATPITGSVSISGGAVFDTTNLATATKVTSFNSALVSSDTGAYAGTFGDAVTYKPFGFNPSTAPITSLWSYTDAGTGYTYSLDLTSLSIAKQTSSDLILAGTGTLNITGSGSPFVATNGSWRFTVNDSSGGNTGNYTFGFSSSDSAIPDSGATGLLLGLGLVTVGFAAKRKLRANA